MLVCWTRTAELRVGRCDGSDQCGLVDGLTITGNVTRENEVELVTTRANMAAELRRTPSGIRQRSKIDAPTDAFYRATHTIPTASEWTSP
jgi:hypothetical protein